MTEPAVTRLDAVRYAVLLILRSAHDKGISKEQVIAWLKNSDWQQFFYEVRSLEKQCAADDNALTPDLFRRLNQLIHLEGQPLASAREISLSDIPPTSVELAPYHAQIQTFLSETSDNRFIFNRDPTRFASGKALVQLPPDQRILAIRAVIERLLFIAGKLPSFGPTLIQNEGSASDILWPLNGLLNRLLRATLPLTEQDLANLLTLRPTPAVQSFAAVSLAAALHAVEHYLSDRPLTEPLRAGLLTLQAAITKHLTRTYSVETKETREHRRRITALLSPESAHGFILNPLETAEPWAAAAQRDIDSLLEPSRDPWRSLLHHIQSADGSKPTKKWLQEAKSRLDAFGRDHFRDFLLACLPLTPGHRSDLPYTPQQYVPDPNLLLSDASQQTLKGLAWAASLFNDPAVSAALGDLGETCWKKIPNHGPRSKLVGNAVLWSLSAIGSPHAVAQLTRINSKLKHASARILGDKALNRVADASGQTRADLEEISLPTFNLSPDSTLSQIIDGFTCTLAISPACEVTLSINGPDAKPRKSLPPALKSHPDFKTLQKNLKNLASALAAQRHRLERLFMAPNRSWSYADWKSRYLDHPLLAPLTRRLIWQFSDGNQTLSAVPHNHQLLQSSNLLLMPHSPSMTVKLWHPSVAALNEVRAWRDFLNQHQITQPFKQAHREIYLLTDAERETATYSNRFAAHIIRQHAFAALCAAARLELPSHGLVGRPQYSHSPTPRPAPQSGVLGRTNRRRP